MYTLYGMTGSCSMAVHVILEELKAEYNVVDVRASKPPEFLKANPRGSVPVLVHGEHPIREAAAIISYLLDTHNSPMLPKSGHARASALEWLAFANATMHPAYARVFFLMGAVKDEVVKAQLLDVAIDKINTLWADVNAQLTNNPYVCGNDITAADILLSVIANWLQTNYSSKIILGDNTKRMIKSVTARPAYLKALADEQVEYKTVA